METIPIWSMEVLQAQGIMGRGEPIKASNEVVQKGMKSVELQQTQI